MEQYQREINNNIENDNFIKSFTKIYSGVKQKFLKKHEYNIKIPNKIEWISITSNTINTKHSCLNL